MLLLNFNDDLCHKPSPNGAFSVTTTTLHGANVLVSSNSFQGMYVSLDPLREKAHVSRGSRTCTHLSRMTRCGGQQGREMAPHHLCSSSSGEILLTLALAESITTSSSFPSIPLESMERCILDNENSKLAESTESSLTTKKWPA